MNAGCVCVCVLHRLFVFCQPSFFRSDGRGESFGRQVLRMFVRRTFWLTSFCQLLGKARWLSPKYPPPLPPPSPRVWESGRGVAHRATNGKPNKNA